jgi:hypothetical protein
MRELAKAGGFPLQDQDIELLHAPYLLRETMFLSKLGGTAEIYLPSLYRDGRFFYFIYRQEVSVML